MSSVYIISYLINRTFLSSITLFNFKFQYLSFLLIVLNFYVESTNSNYFLLEIKFFVWNRTVSWIPRNIYFFDDNILELKVNYNSYSKNNSKFFVSVMVKFGFLVRFIKNQKFKLTTNLVFLLIRLINYKFYLFN